MKRVLAIGVLLLGLTGCGTVGNFQGKLADARPYGGVELAVVDVRQSMEGTVVLPWLTWPIIASNVPLSAIGDTLTLPITGSVAAWEASRRWWDLAFHYNKPDPQQKEWREFWFSDQPGLIAPPGVGGGIY
jgi:hypothetical protein